MHSDALPDFSDKIVIVYQKGRDDSSASILDSPVLELQGDRYYLVGTIPERATTNDWAIGATNGIAWDLVAEYYVMSREQHEARY